MAKDKNDYGYYVDPSGNKGNCGIEVILASKEDEFPFDLGELQYLSRHSNNSNIKAFAQTLLHINSLPKKNYGEVIRYSQDDLAADKSGAITSSNVSQLPQFQNKVNVNILKKDIIEYTRELSLKNPGRKIALLNPANRKVLGGGAFHGVNALEELLFRCSDLCMHYVMHFLADGGTYRIYDENDARPKYAKGKGMAEGEAWFTPNVKFFKHKTQNGYENYSQSEQFEVGTIGSTAYYYKDIEAFRSDQANAEIKTKKEIRAQLGCAKKNGVNIPVLTAFGCGEFNNDPELISKWYKEVLYDEGWIQYFDRVDFAIFDDKNYHPFLKRFEPRKALIDEAVQAERDDLFYKRLLLSSTAMGTLGIYLMLGEIAPLILPISIVILAGAFVHVSSNYFNAWMYEDHSVSKNNEINK